MKTIFTSIVVFGITSIINAQNPVNGILNHTNSYFTMNAYSDRYDDGSSAEIFYDGKQKIINFWNSDENTTYTNLRIGNLRAMGNVGIGTNSPSAKLQIQNGGQNLTFLTGENTSGYTVSFGINDDGVNIKNTSSIRGFNFGNKNGNLLKITPNGNILTMGNVGIGTNNPSAKLQIQNGGQNLTFLTGENTSGYTVSFGINDDGVNIKNTSSTRGFNFGNKNGNLLKIAPNGNAALYGKFEAKEIKVTVTPTADFVFENDYQLPTLEFIENHIKNKKHLPEIASAKEMKKNGVNIGKFQIQLLQKIEELTLHTIQQQKEIKELKSQNKKILALEKRLQQLEAEK